VAGDPLTGGSLSDTATRRLLAIMFTDIKGYSSMMVRDEATTHRAMQEHRAIVRAIVPRHGGREQRTIGDAFLLVFESSVGAVACAIEVQEQLLARNAAVAEAERILVRIGIHVGDVLLETDGDVFGTAVNIAARIEPLAPPGGICVTEAVATQVRGHVRRELVPIGVVALKNIDDPPPLYVIAVAPARVARPWPRWPLAVAAGVAAVALIGAAAVQLRPAPGPWAVASADPEAQARFVDAMIAIRRGERHRAEQMAVAGLAIDGGSSRLWLVRALETDDATEAVDAREQAVKLAPAGPEGELVRLADRAIREPDTPELATAWDEWSAANPDDEWGQLVRAALYPPHGHGEPGDAHLAALEAFVAVHPDHVDGRVALDHAEQFAGHPDEAIAVLDEGLRRCPDCAQLHESLGDIRIGQWELEDAEAEYQAAVAEDPSLYVSRSRLADIALHRGDEPTRTRRADAIMADAPPNEKLAFAAWHSRVLYMHGQRQAARDLLDRGLAVAATTDPSQLVEMQISRAWHEVELLDAAAARVATQQLRDASAAPEVPSETRDHAAIQAVIVDGRIAWVEGDAAAAAEAARRLNALSAERFRRIRRDLALDEVGWPADALAGRTDDALARIARLPQDCGRAWHRAKVLERAGRDVEADWDPVLGLPCTDEYGGAQVDAAVHLARAARERGDADKAARVLKQARDLWPAPDADLQLAKDLAAAEASARP
jgi:class 3 adenylate cyclase/tetratricopeptide (TPR) repeat protein